MTTPFASLNNHLAQTIAESRTFNKAHGFTELTKTDFTILAVALLHKTKGDKVFTPGELRKNYEITHNFQDLYKRLQFLTEKGLLSLNKLGNSRVSPTEYSITDAGSIAVKKHYKHLKRVKTDLLNILPKVSVPSL